MDLDPCDGPVLDQDEVEHLHWLDRWAPRCPIGNPQRVRRCLAYREREPGRLQLRVALAPSEGVCEVVTDEQEDVVWVRVLLCYDPAQGEDDEQAADYCDCPVHVYLDNPLGGRDVYDVQTNAILPLLPVV